jgi:hypothetical protein
MVTPRVRGGAGAGAGAEAASSAPSEGARRYVAAKGELVDVTGGGAPDAQGRAMPLSASLGTIDSSHIARHEANLSRFRFGDRGSPAPRGPL